MGSARAPQQRRRVDRAEGRGRKWRCPRARNEVIELIARDRLRRAALQRRHSAAIDVGGAGDDPKLEMLRLIGLRPGQPEVEIGRADAGRGDRKRRRLALMRFEPHRLAQRGGLGRQRPMNVEVERVVARLALDIVDLDMHLRTVADIEEARQGRGDDDRIAHHHVGLAEPTLSSTTRRPPAAPSR